MMVDFNRNELIRDVKKLPPKENEELLKKYVGRKILINRDARKDKNSNLDNSDEVYLVCLKRTDDERELYGAVLAYKSYDEEYDYGHDEAWNGYEIHCTGDNYYNYTHHVYNIPKKCIYPKYRSWNVGLNIILKIEMDSQLELEF